MKKTIILAAFLAAFILLTLILALSQTQDKKPPGDARDVPPASNTESSPDATESSQDASVIAPQAYRREFENARVRVTRVRYEAREFIKSHEHPKLPTVYVYLTDSGPIRFVHTGDEKFINVRPAVKAGSFRLARAAAETHEVESLSDRRSDFLRIELKDLEVDKATFRGRFPPEPNRTVESSEKISFDNPQLRIVRVTCAPVKICKAPVQTAPYLLVALNSFPLKTAINDGVLTDSKTVSGQTIWVEAGEQLNLQTPGSAPVRFLRIEFKTPS
jgi:hypothetical protein